MKEKKYVSTGGAYKNGEVPSKIKHSTVKTKNESFDKNGYLFVPGLISDPENYYCVPLLDPSGKKLTGQLNYANNKRFEYLPNESQVNGSLARYNAPMYRHLHYLVRKKIEPILGIDLLPTYFFDRFYYPGQQLHRHIDRTSCEVSVTLQISTNVREPWPIWFERPDESESYVVMNNGDAAVYKGCEREHWRDPLESRYNKLQRTWRKIIRKDDDTYHHQIFLHYVNAQGPYVHFANDPGVS